MRRGGDALLCHGTGKQSDEGRSSPRLQPEKRRWMSAFRRRFRLKAGLRSTASRMVERVHSSTVTITRA
jgi:hypothetical protein